MHENFQRLHAQIFGHVQGVSFRFYTQLRATELELTGWVRNLSDGSVEVTAEGPREQLDEMLQFLQTGPKVAVVSRVEVEWLAARGEFVDFQVR